MGNHLCEPLKMPIRGFHSDNSDEPWAVRRFYVRDPFGKLINVLAHI